VEVINIYTRKDQPKFIYYHVDTEINEVCDYKKSTILKNNAVVPTKVINNYLLVRVHKKTGLSVGSFFASEEEFNEEYEFLDKKTF